VGALKKKKKKKIPIYFLREKPLRKKRQPGRNIERVQGAKKEKHCPFLRKKRSISKWVYPCFLKGKYGGQSSRILRPKGQVMGPDQKTVPSGRKRDENGLRFHTHLRKEGTEY